MLDAVARLMSGYPHPWWIAGGWAVDLYLGAQPRAHEDVDIAVLRRDQGDLYRHICGWRPQKVVGGSLLPWGEDEALEPPVHEIHVFPRGERLELLLNEAEADRWVFRRNASVSMPLRQLTRRTASGLPILCPEVVLLYKAKRPLSRDNDDFARVVPRLGRAAKEWLASALEICHPGHEWRAAVLQ
jgi:hypothetical protein